LTQAADTATGAASPMGRSGLPLPAWDTPPRRPLATAASPVLAVVGFEGPLDWLLELARARKVDLARLSILALVEAFAGAMDTALNRGSEMAAPDLAQWATWTVMASHLAELRSRLLLPADAPEARTAQAEAEALRRQWVCRAEMAAAADWLERRHQLGRDVFARGWSDTRRLGRPADAADLLNIGETDDPVAVAVEAASGSEDVPPVAGGDLTDLLRACLVALRLPPHAEAYQPRRLPFWSVGDAAARISRLLQERSEGGKLEVFLPKIAESGSGRAVHCRAAVAATFVAGLELTRDGALAMDQDAPWQPIQVSRRHNASLDRVAAPTADERTMA